MKHFRPYLLTLILFLAGGIIVALAQTNSLTIGAFTIDATGAPALTVKPPTRAGTLAITADIPVTPPGANVIAGSVTLSGAATFTGLSAPPICTVTPVFNVTATGLQITRLDYVCTPKNN